MTQVRLENFSNQSTYMFHARKADTPNQAAARTETMRLTAMAINRISTLREQP